MPACLRGWVQLWALPSFFPWHSVCALLRSPLAAALGPGMGPAVSLRCPRHCRRRGQEMEPTNWDIWRRVQVFPDCVEERGSGERHVVVLPSYPKYKVGRPWAGRGCTSHGGLVWLWELPCLTLPASCLPTPASACDRPPGLHAYLRWVLVLLQEVDAATAMSRLEAKLGKKLEDITDGGWLGGRAGDGRAGAGEVGEAGGGSPCSCIPLLSSPLPTASCSPRGTVHECCFASRMCQRRSHPRRSLPPTPPSPPAAAADLTPELACEVLGYVDKAVVEERLAAAEEAAMVADFRRNLEYNLGKVGGVGCWASPPWVGWGGRRGSGGRRFGRQGCP